MWKCSPALLYFLLGSFLLLTEHYIIELFQVAYAGAYAHPYAGAYTGYANPYAYGGYPYAVAAPVAAAATE